MALVLLLLQYPSVYGALLVVSNLVMSPFYSGRSLTGFHNLYNLVQLVMQWLSGALVLILCIVKRGELSRQIVTKLGSSFSTVAFVIVVATCTILAMVATVPLVQLLFFHILLIKKGISTYDYIIALREQEDQHEVPGHQSPQMSIISSVTGFSTASSFGPLHRGSWCTPPRLFLEDQVCDNGSLLSKIT